MAIKINPLAQQPKIVITVDPVTGNSAMTCQNINQVGVVLALSAQLNSLLPKMFAEMFKGATFVDAKGQPILMTKPEPEPTGNSMDIVFEEEITKQ